MCSLTTPVIAYAALPEPPVVTETAQESVPASRIGATGRARAPRRAMSWAWIPRYIVTIQGKPFATFPGLLTLARQRGLQALKVPWTCDDAELSLAEATAVFPFGTFQEGRGRQPDECHQEVAPHFRRVACTHAAARALRLALGVEVCSVEELADEAA